MKKKKVIGNILRSENMDKEQLQKILEDAIKPNKTSIDINNSSTWRATCIHCGNKNMTFNETRFTYYCNKCGHVLEV